ncbi:MAG: PVC-type heme-binding CxxCH protein [Verrucomicrobiota bacterium]
MIRVAASLLALLWATLPVLAQAGGDPVPKCLDPELRLEAIAGPPDLVTPIGCTVDGRGRVYVLESHTHFPKLNSPGPATDRILMFPGVAGGIPSVFAEGFRWGMNLAAGPGESVYLTHRNGVVRLEGPTGQGRSGGRKDLVVMETAGDYPHNGLGGLAFGPGEWLYLGTGENLGLPYVIRGSDGSSVSRKAGSGGVVVRCRADGTHLELVATGFWNAFGIGFDGHGRLFLVDNDPDSRPPCRLLHVIPGGNYGFQFRHGRDGLSPLIAWDGELPGTLGMVAGTGEAPSSVLDAARTRFPANHGGALLVAAAWDHQVEVFRPIPTGATFRSGREVLVAGNANFRPVSLAAAPDGSVVFTDWVKPDYSVHGSGRLWRLSARHPSERNPDSLPGPNAVERARLELESRGPGDGFARWLAAAGATDAFVRSTAVTRLSEAGERRLDAEWSAASPEARMSLLLAVRRVFEGESKVSPEPRIATEWIRRGLHDGDPRVRTAALVWASEEGVLEVLEDVRQALEGVTPTLRLSELQPVALRMLQGTNTAVGSLNGTADEEIRTIVAPQLPRRAPESECVAGMRDATLPRFLREEFVKELAGTRDPEAIKALQTLALDTRAPVDLRCEAILSLRGTHQDSVTVLLPLLRDPEDTVAIGLARSLQPWLEIPGTRAALEQAVVSGRPEVQRAALQALGRPEPRPSTPEGWMRILEGHSGNPVEGDRVFRSPEAGCSRCHRVLNRGGILGPDLSVVSRGSSRERLLRSLLEPSRDIAPQFAEHRVETREGDVFAGRLVSEEPGGTVTLLAGEGRQVRIPGRMIVRNDPSAVSPMPEGLLEAMSVDDVRDLLSYLESLK